MGGKSSAPAPVDNSAIAAADQANGQLQYQLGEQQLAFAQQQYNDTAPYATQYLQQQTASSAALTQQAQTAQDYYNTNYQPIETQLAQQEANYSNPANDQQRAGAAMADVSNQFDSARAASLSSLESYGIDPSQTRYGALDLGTRISQAAATSAAGTQSGLNSQATGLALEGNAVNVGRGYSSTVAQDYATAQGAGGAGLTAQNQTNNTANAGVASSQGFFNTGNNAYSGAANANANTFQQEATAAGINNQNAASTSQGIGTAVGIAASVAIAI